MFENNVKVFEKQITELRHENKKLSNEINQTGKQKEELVEKMEKLQEKNEEDKNLLILMEGEKNEKEKLIEVMKEKSSGLFERLEQLEVLLKGKRKANVIFKSSYAFFYYFVSMIHYQIIIYLLQLIADFENWQYMATSYGKKNH